MFCYTDELMNQNTTTPGFQYFKMISHKDKYKSFIHMLKFKFKILYKVTCVNLSTLLLFHVLKETHRVPGLTLVSK